jgi:hypothetical protein
MKKIVILILIAALIASLHHLNPSFENHVNQIISDSVGTDTTDALAEKIIEKLDYKDLFIFSFTQTKDKFEFKSIGATNKVYVLDKKWVATLNKR